MIENFKWKQNSNWFDKNPNNIVPWRPRKLFTDVNAELKAKWIIALTKEQLIEAYWLIFNTDEEELVRIAKDKNYPYSLRLIITSLSDKKTRDKAMSDYRDYMFGKAVQKVEWDINLNNQIKVVKPMIDLENRENRENLETKENIQLWEIAILDN